MSPDKNQNDNPIQKEYEQKLNPLNTVKDAEKNPDTGWKNSVTGTGRSGGMNNKSSTLGNKSSKGAISNHTGPIGSKLKFSVANKKGPLTAIILTVVGSAVGISMFLTPSIMLVQFKEIMVNKFNTQLSSMDVRSTMLLTKKMKTLNGICTSSVNIKCKYATMSKKQIEKFEKAGIKVKYDDKNLFGRAKPTSFKFLGKTIKPSEFNKTIKENSAFRAAVKRAYNPKFAGFADAIWVKAATKLGITKSAAKIDGDTDEERLKSMQDNTKNPQTGDSVANRVNEGDQKTGY